MQMLPNITPLIVKLSDKSEHETPEWSPYTSGVDIFIAPHPKACVPPCMQPAAGESEFHPAILAGNYSATAVTNDHPTAAPPWRTRAWASPADCQTISMWRPAWRSRQKVDPNPLSLNQTAASSHEGSPVARGTITPNPRWKINRWCDWYSRDERMGSGQSRRFHWAGRIWGICVQTARNMCTAFCTPLRTLG